MTVGDEEGKADDAPDAWEALPQQTREFVWNVHKEADSLIHARMQTFVTFEASLIGALFTIVILSKDPTQSWYFKVIVVLVGLLTCFAFMLLNRRIIKGVIRLKKEYLSKSAIYKKFYGDAPPRYVLPKYLPVLFAGLWGCWDWHRSFPFRKGGGSDTGGFTPPALRWPKTTLAAGLPPRVVSMRGGSLHAPAKPAHRRRVRLPPRPSPAG